MNARAIMRRNVDWPRVKSASATRIKTIDGRVINHHRAAVNGNGAFCPRLDPRNHISRHPAMTGANQPAQ